MCCVRQVYPAFPQHYQRRNYDLHHVDEAEGVSSNCGTRTAQGYESDQERFQQRADTHSQVKKIRKGVGGGAKSNRGKGNMNSRELESDLSSAPSPGYLSDCSEFGGSDDEEVSIILYPPRYLGCKFVPSIQTYGDSL